MRYLELKGLYEVEKTIGCGGFAKVKLATHLATGEKVAIKIMDKAGLGDDLPRVKLELNALQNFSHQHICKLYQVIETKTHFFLIMEYCAGGELFDHIVEKNRLTETESRKFFRQIVSAVAYLHKQGYAHRDLKPENVLLDKDQNLKLIDFGLCARPAGGIKSPLFTSCGSPTYAAPELVLGKEYLGPEVDVWAMGVLLYTLLVGALPFDDLHIDSLYKKILSGRYEEPYFLSTDSRNLIRSMLQVDPKKRITVSQLLSHHWLTLGFLEPVKINPRDPRIFDEDCIKTIAGSVGLSPQAVWKHLKEFNYDYCTATYLLLMARKKRGASLRLLSPFITFCDQPTERAKENLNIINVKSPAELTLRNRTIGRQLENAQARMRVANNYQRPATPGKAVVERKKSLKRTRSPIPIGEASPVPHKKPNKRKSTSSATPDNRKTAPAGSGDTPGSTRGVLGTIERSINKVRHVLTPKKAHENANKPAVLASKNLCNVSTTQCNDPEYVITELTHALQRMGFKCDRKGFTLKGDVQANALHHCSGCSFELEICYLPKMGPAAAKTLCETPPKSILKNGPLKTRNAANVEVSSPSTPVLRARKNNKLAVDLFNKETSFAFVAIKRKRLKGDSWCYKKVCEEVLAVTTRDLHQITESSI